MSWVRLSVVTHSRQIGNLRKQLCHGRANDGGPTQADENMIKNTSKKSNKGGNIIGKRMRKTINLNTLFDDKSSAEEPSRLNDQD